MGRAMRRIEAALARIEQAAARAPAPSPAAEGSGGGWEAHRALRTRVRGVLGELDGLIGELER